MSNTYMIRWKSMANGRSGRGARLFTREEAEALAEELNHEFPQIQHEAVKTNSESKESSATPARELSFS